MKHPPSPNTKEPPFLSQSLHWSSLLWGNKGHKIRYVRISRENLEINTLSLCFRVFPTSETPLGLYLTWQLYSNTLSVTPASARGELWLSTLQVCCVVEPESHLILFDLKNKSRTSTQRRRFSRITAIENPAAFMRAMGPWTQPPGEAACLSVRRVDIFQQTEWSESPVWWPRWPENKLCFVSPAQRYTQEVNLVGVDSRVWGTAAFIMTMFPCEPCLTLLML